MIWFVYIVECNDGTYYCGATVDINARVILHNTGEGAKYTKGRGPVILKWHKQCANQSDALKLESALKKLSHEAKRILCS